MAICVTQDLLVSIYRCPRARSGRWAEHISAAIHAYGIDGTTARVASFLAQIGHESGRLRYSVELWGPTPQQKRYEPGTSLARRLGNTEPGDGKRFRGHGLIQTTGRANHCAIRDRLRAKFQKLNVPDFEEEPERLSDPLWAALSAADYWDMRGLNKLADRHDFVNITKRINGGLNGMADRKQLHTRALAILQQMPVLAVVMRPQAPTSQPVFYDLSA